MINRYFVAILPQGAVTQYHSAITNDINGRFGIRINPKLFPTHITLKAPFEANEDQIIQLKNLFQEYFSHHITPPLYRVCGYGHLGRQVINLDVLHSIEMEILATKISELLGGFSWMSWQKHEPIFHFHITVLKNNIFEKFDELWEYLCRRDTRFNLHFDNVALLRKEENSWVVDSIYQISL